MSLSKEEAVLFLRDVLQVPNSLLLEKQPSLPFLNGIIKSYQNTIPWQTVTSWAVPNSQRHLPTWGEIKKRQFAKEGGMCYENNMFMKELLNALNFDVCYIPCQFWDPDDHMSVMVRGLTGRSSRHWVEAGSSCPLFQAIPFDFETDSTECDVGFLRHRFVKSKDCIEWQHSRIFPPFDASDLTKEGKWFKIATIMADTPCDVDHFKYRMTIRYTMLEQIAFFHKIRAVVFEKNKLISMKGMQLVLETKDKTVEERSMKNTEEVVQAYKAYFPQIPTGILQDALKNNIKTMTESKHSHNLP
ncbi:hypothetical protein HOLleu_13761 [Holothuria leucospilota]|uniref:arylamine N-acetyltransferase n=1 Tax=Holothuria leucospilota TaxID=206669 RepID=A0A9Q1C857_HOLLE|nr:hypothetical protein HOLleu_13761 [Holothuria leucospilota]